jgi:RES domain-containing protein
VSHSPYAYVTFDTPEHLHMVQLGDGQVCVLETEEAAELLADAVARCNPERHNGHGTLHSEVQVEASYKSAVSQLLNTSDEMYEHEYRERMRKIRVHKKWGGKRPVPAAVIMPGIDGSDDWGLLTVGREGTPRHTPLRAGVMDGLMPSPQEMGAQPDPSGMGWLLKTTWSAQRKLKGLARRERQNGKYGRL